MVDIIPYNASSAACSTHSIRAGHSCCQVDELRMQLQQLESRLGAAQLALRHSSSKSPAKSHQLTASLDAFSPSQTRQSFQDKPAEKKMRTDTSPPLPSQTLTTQDTATAADITADINSVPMTQLPSIAALQGNDRVCRHSETAQCFCPLNSRASTV